MVSCNPALGFLHRHYCSKTRWMLPGTPLAAGADADPGLKHFLTWASRRCQVLHSRGGFYSSPWSSPALVRAHSGGDVCYSFL